MKCIYSQPHSYTRKALLLNKYCFRTLYSYVFILLIFLLTYSIHNISFVLCIEDPGDPSLIDCDRHGLCMKIAHMSKREAALCDQQHDCITPFKPDCANDQKLSNDYYCNAADCIEIEALVKTNEKDCGKWFARSNLTPDDRLNTYISNPTSDVLGQASKRIGQERLGQIWYHAANGFRPPLQKGSNFAKNVQQHFSNGMNQVSNLFGNLRRI